MSWRRFFRRDERHAEAARDLQFYLDTETADNLARGMSSEDARAAARRKLGNTGLIQEEIYRMNSAVFLESIWRDLLYALRTLRQNPAFAATAVFTLALGIGGNTAIFTVIRAVLLKPLEYREPGRLIYFSMENARRNEHDATFTLTRLEEMRAAQQSFTGLGAFLGSPESLTLSGAGEPEVVRGARVSANFLDILGVAPLLGRGFLPEEDAAGAARVAIISERLWRRRFAADAAIVGRAVPIDAAPYTIVGVLPSGFEFPLTGADVWVPRPSEWSRFAGSRYGRNLSVLAGFGRLKPGVSLAQASAEMQVLNQQYLRSHPNPVEKDAKIQILWLKDRLVSSVRPMLWMLFGAVGFVLLIACANVASLMLARATSRSREFALRAALGAGRGRLIGQLLAESLVLACAGGAIGLLLAKWALHAITLVDALSLSSRVTPVYLPGSGALQLDGAVFAFTELLSIATGVLFGLFPSVQVSRPDLADVLRESGAGAGRGALGRRGWFGVSPRALLVVAQVALSVILLIGAALLMRSFAQLHGVDPGFEPANLLTMKIALPPARYDTDLKRSTFFTQLIDRVEAVPGVLRATEAMTLPTTTWARTNITEVEGQPPLDAADPSSFAVELSVTPDYFQTMKIPLKRGREFTARDNTPGAPPVVIINETLARRLWPDDPRGVNPVGLHMKEGWDKFSGWMEIVGVAADIHEGSLASNPVQEFYLPCALHPPQTAYLAARTAGDPLRLANSIRAQVLALDADQPVSDIRTMEAVLDATLGSRRLTMTLLGSFAAVALLLAVIGIYGVIAYSVAQRTQEVGIRRALGAQPRDILRLVAGQGLGLALAGIALGIAGAFALTRVITGLLFRVSATDPWTFAAIALLFAAVALAACVIPARRAVKIDPMTALRI